MRLGRNIAQQNGINDKNVCKDIKACLSNYMGSCRLLQKEEEEKACANYMHVYPKICAGADVL